MIKMLQLQMKELIVTFGGDGICLKGSTFFTFIDDLFQTENQIIKSDGIVKTIIYYLFEAVILIYHCLSPIIIVPVIMM